MRKILTIICFLGPVLSFAKQGGVTKLSITFNDCRRAGESYHGMDSLYIYTFQGGFVGSYGADEYGANHITISNFNPGKYKFKYTNNYDQLVEKNIAVTGDSVNKFMFCVDSAAAYKRNALKLLPNHDSIVIDLHSRGCFHNYRSKLVIVKQEPDFFAYLYKGHNSRRHPSTDTALAIADSTKLTVQNIAAFNRFENEITYLRKSCCTTVDYYIVRYRGRKHSFIDGTCSWGGFYYLKKSLFPGQISRIRS